MLKKFKEFISINSLKLFRFLSHWISLPFKILYFEIYLMISSIYNLFHPVNITNILCDEEKGFIFQTIYKDLPIFENEQIKLYCPDSRGNVDGSNHITTNQLIYQGLYAFLMSKLGKRDSKIDQALYLHIHGKWLINGMKRNEFGQMIIDDCETTANHLLSLALSILGASAKYVNPAEIVLKDPEQSGVYALVGDDILRDKFDILIHELMANDLSLYHTYTIPPLYIPFTHKATEAIFHPGIKLSPKKAIILLAVLQIVGIKLGSLEAKRMYKKLTRWYGYKLLAFSATYSVESLIAAYLLARVDPKCRLWKLILFKFFLLHFRQFNGLTTGFIKEICPSLISKKYLEKTNQISWDLLPDMKYLLWLLMITCLNPIQAKEWVNNIK